MDPAARRDPIPRPALSGIEPPAASASRLSQAPNHSAWLEWSYTCDLCGAPMEERKCKILCKSCGYLRDCSDP